MLAISTIAVALLLTGGHVSAQNESQIEGENLTQEVSNCVSREEFDPLQKELNYWQNTTISILKKYLIDNEVEDSSHCTVTEDSYLKDKVDALEQKMDRILNQTECKNFNPELLLNKMERIEERISHPSLGSFLNPASFCKLIPQGSPSGHYWIQHTGTGYANLEYCDMTRICCNSTGGWMRVANINMTDTNQQCPSGFRLITSPKRTCGTPGRSCVSTTFPLNGVKYTKVCGKIIGYQFGTPGGFGPYYNNKSYTINSGYVDGVSLTHGLTPRKHIWTFAAAIHEISPNSIYINSNLRDKNICRCHKSETDSYIGVVPPFVKQDYFCDTGNHYDATETKIFYHANPLWDGSGCGSTSSCCGFNNPPWFCKQLPQPTSDDIEMRVCLNGRNTDEDVALESFEIYVQ